MRITDILQYPIKGLSHETLTSTALTVTAGMPADRLFAITHGHSQFSFDNPTWIARKNFAVVAHSPEITTVQCQFDHASQTLKLSHEGSVILNACVDAPDIDAKLSDAMSKVMKDGQPGPYKLVRAGSTRFTDIPTPTVSIMNKQSLEALETATDQSLQKRRFRGNIWFDGETPWQEHDWIGKSIRIGEVQLHVTERIERCPAIDADPNLGVRNIPLLKQLHKNFDHADFGVLATIETASTIHQGDEIALC